MTSKSPWSVVSATFCAVRLATDLGVPARAASPLATLSRGGRGAWALLGAHDARVAAGGSYAMDLVNGCRGVRMSR